MNKPNDSSFFKFPKLFTMGAAVLAVLASPTMVHAASVTTTNSDGFGSSSFNSAGVWSDGLAPSGGNDYLIDDEDRVRTPADNGSHTFAGDSLTVQAVGSGGDFNIKGLSYKGSGAGATITVDNLILDGGSINHINGGGDIFNLDGNLSVISDSIMWAKQGPINVYSAISGSAQITIPASDAFGNELSILSSANTYTGNIINNGRFTLADDANLNFVIGASGVNNSISSPGGQQHSFLDGDFVFDLSGAGTTVGDSWAVDTTTAASTYYGTTFTVAGFTDAGGDQWIKGVTGGPNPDLYLFDESTGILSVVVPEPSSAALLLGVAALLGLRRSRRA